VTEAEEDVYEGEWWIATEPEQAKPGTLTVNRDGSAKLRLLGGFDTRVRREIPNGYTYSGANRPIDVILGRTEQGHEVTLIDLVASSSRISWGDQILSQTLRPERVIIGVHLPDLSAPVFNKARISIENLQQWASIGDAEHSIPENRSSHTVTVNQHPPISFEANGCKFTLHHRIGLFGWRRTRVGIDMVNDTRVFIEVENEAGVPHDGFDDIVFGLVDLITFAGRAPVAPTSYSIVHQDSDIISLPRWITAVTNERQDVERRRERIGHIRARWTTAPNADIYEGSAKEYLFSGSDLAIDSCIPKWLVLRSKIRRGLDMLLSLTYGASTFLQTEVLVLAVSAEAMHRVLWDGALLMIPAEFERIMQTALRGLEEDDQDLFRRAIHNEPTYFHRLCDLAEIPDTHAVARVIPDVIKWARQLTNVRNGLAHALSNRHEDLDELFALFTQTRQLLELVVIASLDASAEVQIAALDRRP
jgi:hypothetical protein